MKSKMLLHLGFVCLGLNAITIINLDPKTKQVILESI